MPSGRMKTRKKKREVMRGPEKLEPKFFEHWSEEEIGEIREARKKVQEEFQRKLDEVFILTSPIRPKPDRMGGIIGEG